MWVFYGKGMSSFYGLWIMPVFMAFLMASSCAPHRVALQERVLVTVHPAPAPEPSMGPEAVNRGAGAEKEVGSKAGFQAIAALKGPGRARLRPVRPKLKFSTKKMVSVAVDEMALSDFIHYIFSDILAVNYVVDPGIQNSKRPVTLNLNRQLSERDLFQLVETILNKQGIRVFYKEGIFYIWKYSGSENFALGIGASVQDIPSTTGEVQQIIPVRYADVQNLIQFLPRPRGLRIFPAMGDNMLVASGSRDQVEHVVRFVAMLDQPAMRGRYIGMMRLIYWSPADMVKKLADLLTEEGIPVTDRPGRRGVYMISVDRLGSIIAFAAQKQWLERVRHWIKILDMPSGAKMRYFLYFPKNSKASELGASLERLLSISARQRVAPQSARVKQIGTKQVAPGKSAKQKAQKVIAQVGRLNGEIRFAVDESRNALIFYATPQKYGSIREILERLDVMPVQVLLEATVAEVTLTGSLQYGLEWFLKNTAGAQTSILRTLGGLGLGSGGLDYSLITDSEKFQLLINALAQQDMVKILSSPRVTVRDGKTASIVVGTEVPVITSEATTPEVQTQGTSGIIRSVQYRSTGVSLQVTPSVHAKGVVTLQISQEVSEAQANNTSNINSPIILNRSLTTEVVAADGQTVLLGGLIKENKSNTVTKVPVLGDIPVLGYLFKTTSKGSDRTELVIMITPHIIRNTQQIDEMRDAIFDSFKNIAPTIGQ